MKTIYTLLFLFLLPALIAQTITPADLVVEKIEIPANGFIHIGLTNRSSNSIAIQPQLLEQTMVTIYINDIPRAEYKLKYLDQRLFQPQGRILLRTNFRAQGEQKIKIICNPLRIIAELNYNNNILEKTIRPNGK